MSDALQEVTKAAMDLPLDQRMKLARLLMDTAEGVEEADADAAWDSEIRDRIRAIDEGREIGIPWEDVMREARERRQR
jgi:putative addiction module component (TIGR02574 family)